MPTQVQVPSSYSLNIVKACCKKLLRGLYFSLRFIALRFVFLLFVFLLLISSASINTYADGVTDLNKSSGTSSSQGAGSNSGKEGGAEPLSAEVNASYYHRPGLPPNLENFKGKAPPYGRTYRPAVRPWQQGQSIANRDDSQPAEATAYPNLKTQGPVEQLILQGAGFYYPADFGARYIRAKANWREAHGGEPIALATMQQLALQTLDPKPDTLRLLSHWRIQGGPAPWLFYPVVLLTNPSLSEAMLNVRLKMKLEFQFGQYFVDPSTLLVDYEHLQQSAQWETVLERERLLHSMAPQEDAQVVLNPVDLLLAMEHRSNQWPYAVRLTVTVLPSGQVSQSTTLTLTPDHFALPLSFY